MPLSIILICGYLIGLNTLQKSSGRNGRPEVPPFLEEGAELSSAGVESSYLIDLNHASVEELTLLDGIGVALARRIIEKREELGGFQNVEELKQVRGIGDSTLEAIRHYIIVE